MQPLVEGLRGIAELAVSCRPWLLEGYPSNATEARHWSAYVRT